LGAREAGRDRAKVLAAYDAHLWDNPGALHKEEAVAKCAEAGAVRVAARKETKGLGTASACFNAEGRLKKAKLEGEMASSAEMQGNVEKLLASTKFAEKVTWKWLRREGKWRLVAPLPQPPAAKRP